MTSKRKTKEIVRPRVNEKTNKEKAYEKMFKKSEEPEEKTEEPKTKTKSKPKEEEKEKIKTGYYLTESTIKAIKRAAVDYDINYSDIVEDAVNSYLDKKYFD